MGGQRCYFLLLVLLVMGGGQRGPPGVAPQQATSQVGSCPFNPLCSCKVDTAAKFLFPEDLHSTSNAGGIRDVYCVGVSFAKMPDLPSGAISHVDVVSSDLEVVDNTALQDVSVDSLRLMSNRIFYIGDRAFSSMPTALKSLDLSYNELDEIPFGALRHLRALDWLNLHSNHIWDLGESEWSHTRSTLTNLFLGENRLKSIPSEVLTSFPQLISLNLDSNMISRVGRATFPRNIQTLSLSHNLLDHFPADTIDDLPALLWMYLRGNYLEELPPYTFRQKRRMNKLDLGENFIRSLSPNMFNDTLSMTDLMLDFNQLESLPAQAFRGMNVGRLYLSMNRLKDMDERAFVGVGHSLQLLDMEHNQLGRLPRALSHLHKLRYLYVPSNSILELDDDSLDSFSDTLWSLSLSGNQLTRVPSMALRNCKLLSHLNLGYNQIEEVLPEDLAGWAGNLETLLLRNNRITFLAEGTFKHAPKLRELSLSFNKISAVDPKAFEVVGSSLESLEMSFGMYRDAFPEDFLKPLTNLAWLALDNNNMASIGETALYSFGKLQYLNLEANRLSSIPPGAFHRTVHRSLRDVRLAYNHLQVLQADTFTSLEELQTLVLSGNRLRAIHSQAFRELPRLVTLTLANNVLTSLSQNAFQHLPSLMKLDLQCNQLKELYSGVFGNVSTPILPLALNLSRNQLSLLHHPRGMAATIHVKTLDLSNNRLQDVPGDFLRPLADSLQRLHLGHNKILRLEEGGLSSLSSLQVLTLEHNGIGGIRRGVFRELVGLQELDLSHNHIEQLPFSLLANLSRLRSLDISHNHIRSLPHDVFLRTRMERLDLSHNEIVVMPGSALSEVARTLRYLDVSHNHIEHLDSTISSNFPNLVGLTLARNRLTNLPDNVFSSLGNLMRLDLSGNNPLRANFKELFHYLQRIKVLNLANTGLRTAPPVPLPVLASLNLSNNLIDNVPASNLEALRTLRILDISSNRLSNVPSHALGSLPNLHKLDVSRNPIRMLTKESFAGMQQLEDLRLQDLPLLERFDSDALGNMVYLRSLKIQTWPNIEKYRFRLGSVLASLPSLRTLSVHVMEDTLSDQLLGALGPKLRELELTGEHLSSIELGSLDGLQDKQELLLRFRHTSLQELPAGLLRGLSNVAHLSLDLRDNRLASLSPTALYPNGSNWETVGTKLISGGVALQGNPWSCDCGLVWVGHWLRRWLRESLQIHTVMLEGAQQLQAMARQAACSDPRTGQQTPLLDLFPDDLNCHASALSHAAGARIAGLLPPMHMMAACLLLRRVVS